MPAVLDKHDIADVVATLEGERFERSRAGALPAHHGPPEPLLGVGHKTENQLLRDQALHQAFRVREVSLAPAGGPIRLGLRKVQRARSRARVSARPAR